MACYLGCELKILKTFQPPKKVKISREQASKFCAARALAWMRDVKHALQVPTDTPESLVSEFPEVYHDDGQDNDRNDLLPLCATVGAIEVVQDYMHTWRVAPKEWKSNLKKEIKLAQIRHKLMKDPAEALVVRAFETFMKEGRTDLQFEKDCSHAFDAAGIGLFWLGR